MSDAKGKGKYHLLLCLLVVLWGLEFSIAKDALNSVDTFMILNFKYFLGMIFIGSICLKKKDMGLPEIRDLPFIIAATILGHIVYFYCEYYALKCNVPVTNISVLYGFLPVGTVIIEKIIFKRSISLKLIVSMFVCIVGIILTIGVDLSSLTEGKGIGYVMVLCALGAWLAYLFLTEDTTNKYGALRIAFYQTFIAWALTIPAMIPHIPEFASLDHKVLLEMIYLGIVSEGLCFLIEVTGIEKLGSTISAVYSNFLPVTSAFFGMVLLGQDLVLLQYIGGVTVIAAGIFIIREKDRLDEIDRLK